MSKIRIRYFGPIGAGNKEDDGWIDINKVTVFIGNQGSGKSTIAKLISTFSWIEKALVRGDFNQKWFEEKGRFRNTFLKYHRINNYIKPNRWSEADDFRFFAQIEYVGNAYEISYTAKDKLRIKKLEQSDYSLPQIMYVPAERNFLSYVSNPKDLKLSSDALKEFLTEFDNAKKEIKAPITIPINDVNLRYDRLNDSISIEGLNYGVQLAESSSGFQSLVPLYLVSDYLSDSVRKNSENRESMSTKEMNEFKKEVEEVFSNDSLTDEQKRLAISVLSKRFNKTSFINIVEEPEQNLFPTSQWKMILELLNFNNRNSDNKLIITTHSPYIVNYLSIAIEAKSIGEQISLENKILLEKLTNIVPTQSMIRKDEISIYELDEKNGTVKKLPTYHGIPSDRNLLNESLASSNELFNQLLEIEQEL